jgi:hypothetical protein
MRGWGDGGLIGGCRYIGYQGAFAYVCVGIIAGLQLEKSGVKIVEWGWFGNVHGLSLVWMYHSAT